MQNDMLLLFFFLAVVNNYSYDSGGELEFCFVFGILE